MLITVLPYQRREIKKNNRLSKGCKKKEEEERRLLDRGNFDAYIRNSAANGKSGKKFAEEKSSLHPLHILPNATGIRIWHKRVACS